MCAFGCHDFQPPVCTLSEGSFGLGCAQKSLLGPCWDLHFLLDSLGDRHRFPFPDFQVLPLRLSKHPKKDAPHGKLY